MNTQVESSSRCKAALIRVGIFLFLSGVATKANGIFLAINQNWFSLDYTKAMLAPLFFFFASVFIAPFAGAALYRFGFKRGIISGIVISALSSLFLFVSHLSQNYLLFLFSIFLLGFGIKFLLVAGPSYSVVAGTKETESGRLSFIQSFYAIGALLTPGIFWLVFDLDLAPQNKVVSFAYLAFFVFWVIVGVTIWILRRLPVVQKVTYSEEEKSRILPPFTKTIVFSFLAMFVYMGIEVSLDSLLVKFLMAEDGGGLSLAKAMNYFTIYYLGFVIGRICIAPIMNRVSLPAILSIHAVVAISIFSGAIFFSGTMVLFAAVFLGLCNSIIYPLLLAIGVKEEKSTPPSKVIGFLSTGAIGGALLPLVQGVVADRVGLRLSFLVPLSCYFGLLLYGAYLRVKAKEKAALPIQNESALDEP